MAWDPEAVPWFPHGGVRSLTLIGVDSRTDYEEARALGGDAVLFDPSLFFRDIGAHREQRPGRRAGGVERAGPGCRRAFPMAACGMVARAFGTFFDGALSRQERACLTSFVRAGHAVTLFSYAPVALPPGVQGRDAAEILPQAALYRDVTGGLHHGTVSQFTNHFRYAMIARTGLVWIDADVICLRTDWPDGEWLLAWEDGCLINGAILGLPRRHPMLAQAVAAAERFKDLTIWGITGPYLLTALAREHRVYQHVLPADVLYPLHYSRAGELVAPLAPGASFWIPEAALCIHLWNDILRQGGHDRILGPPPGSPLAALLDWAEGSTIPRVPEGTAPSP